MPAPGAPGRPERAEGPLLRESRCGSGCRVSRGDHDGAGEKLASPRERVGGTIDRIFHPPRGSSVGIELLHRDLLDRFSPPAPRKINRFDLPRLVPMRLALTSPARTATVRSGELAAWRAAGSLCS